MSIEQDKIQFGLTKENNLVIERLDELGMFSEQQEAAKFAMSYAIRLGIQPGVVSQADTKWHSAGFDKTGELASAIQILYPDVRTPYRAIEYLVNQGLALIGKHLDDKGTLDILSLIDPKIDVGQSSDS